MARAIKDWLHSFSIQNVQIWCEDPETNVEKFGGYGSKTYLTYRILLKQIGRDIIGVRHRYSEFETLRNQLKDRYAPLGICVPSLPPKNSIKFVMMGGNKTDAAMVKERTSGLTMFCEVNKLLCRVLYFYHDIVSIDSAMCYMSFLCCRLYLLRLEYNCFSMAEQ